MKRLLNPQKALILWTVSSSIAGFVLVRLFFEDEKGAFLSYLSGVVVMIGVFLLSRAFVQLTIGEGEDNKARAIIASLLFLPLKLGFILIPLALVWHLGSGVAKFFCFGLLVVLMTVLVWAIRTSSRSQE